MSEAERLTWDAVDFGDALYYEAELRGFNASLRPGDCMRVVSRQGRIRLPLADLAQGLRIADAGHVFWKDRSWAAWPPEQAADERLRMGRVFLEAGFISNLDIDENILLPRLMAGVDARTAREDAEALARRFGWNELPSVRPARAGRKDLMIGQWIRALAGDTSLILLEYPETGVTIEEFRMLLGAVEEKRLDGAVVLWITAHDDRPSRTDIVVQSDGEVRDGVFSVL